jgi:molecular chaperone HtpG
VTDDQDMGLQLQRLLKAAGQEIGEVKPIFELNPTHPLILQLKDKVNAADFDDLTHILFDQAILAEGGQLKDPASFVQRLNKMLLA